MVKRSLLVLGLVGFLVAGASADVVFTYESDADADGDPSNGIQLDSVPQTVKVDIGVLSTTGSQIGYGGGGFNFAPVPTEMTTDSFSWDPRFDNENQWFQTPGLPAPELAGFQPGLYFIQTAPGGAGEHLLASLTVTVNEIPEGVGLELPTNPLAFDDVGPNELTTDGGTSILFTPEPATLALLMIGGCSLVRRRS